MRANASAHRAKLWGVDEWAVFACRWGREFFCCKLGDGGMGVVYKARDVELDDIVALKMLKGEITANPEVLERMKSEIRLARKITHPNVLRTHDFGELNGVPYISMEYIRGMTLSYLLKQTGRLPYSACLRIARQICAGLAAVHEIGVLHRDLKPENVILEPNGNAKLMDFGIARPIERDIGQTKPGLFVGTPRYASPEQLSGGEMDVRSDIYSLGVVLCELFTGKLPIKGSNFTQISIAHLHEPPVPPSSLWAEIPSEVEWLILKCLEKKPADRLATAQELVDRLAALRA